MIIMNYQFYWMFFCVHCISWFIIKYAVGRFVPYNGGYIDIKHDDIERPKRDVSELTCPPVINTVILTENNMPQLPIFAVAIKDSDRIDNVAYSLECISAFTINSTTGIVSTVISLDREVMGMHHTCKVIVSTDASVKGSCTLFLEITILDENDNKPVLTETVYQTDITENQPVMSTILSVTAFDADFSLNGSVRYMPGSGFDNLIFALNSKDGSIVLKRTLYEKPQRTHTFSVLAEDQAPVSKRLTAYTEVVININAGHNNTLEFRQKVYWETISKNWPAGSPIIALRARYSHKDEIRYSLLDTKDASNSVMDPESGIIALHRCPVGQGKPEIELRVFATVQHQNATALVKINILPTVAPTFFNEPYIVTVGSTFDTNQPVIKVSAYDNNKGLNGPIAYSIKEGNDKSIFSIDSKTGIVIIEVPLSELLSHRQFKLYVEASYTGIPNLTSGISVYVYIKTLPMV